VEQEATEGRIPRMQQRLKPHRGIPLYLFLFALLTRLVALGIIHEDGDNVRYFEDLGIAINLLEGRGYVLNFSMLGEPVPLRPTAAKPPVYPFLVAFVFFIFGVKNFLALFVVHAFLAALTCVFLYLSIVKFSHSKAVIAAAAFAAYLPFVHHSVAVPESTTLTLFLISLFVYGLMKLDGSVIQRRWICLGISGGVLALTDPVTVPFIILSLFYAAYVNFRENTLLQMSIAVAVFVATIAPWSLRNYLAFNEFVFIKSSFGASLKDSLYRSGVRLSKEEYQSLVKKAHGMNEVKEDQAIKGALVSWIRANPGSYLRQLPRNFMNFWWATERYKNDRSASYIVGRKIPYVLLLIISVPSLLWRLSQVRKTGQLRRRANLYYYSMLILICTYTAIYTLIGSWNIRYHFPVEMALLVFFAATVHYVAGKLGVPSKASSLTSSRNKWPSSKISSHASVSADAIDPKPDLGRFLRTCGLVLPQPASVPILPLSV
jgi:4-amino-4-deoxy-L-arabinose transferase-like glycosyltransferase